MNDQVIIFGGVASNGTESNHEVSVFSDVICYSKSLSVEQTSFQIKFTTGNVPMARSSHTVVTYGKFMFLFGGIVPSREDEDAGTFNDLYIFCTGEKCLYTSTASIITKSS